jgi:hypothetical protein
VYFRQDQKRPEGSTTETFGAFVYLVLQALLLDPEKARLESWDSF